MGPRRLFRALAGLLVVLAVLLLASRCRAGSTTVPRLRARVVASYDHDRSSYTQGLLWHDGALYESTGQYGQSKLRQVELETGRVLREHALDDAYFAEGLARVGERLIQLTWQEGHAFVYDVADFAPAGEFRYDGEGWGLCSGPEGLWMSDGTDLLELRDNDSFAVVRELRVTIHGRALPRLNELECAEGWVYANVYGSDQIVRIDPASGEVRAVIQADGLLTSEESTGIDVLNGIAYDPEREAFFITGKYWPKLFEVVFEQP